MEDPVSPAASITGSLWEADSDTSADSGNIYEDLATPLVSDSDSDVSDSDIFQELRVVTHEGEQLPSSKEISETQEKADILSNERKKEKFQNDKISEVTASHQDASSCNNDTTRPSLLQTEKEKGKKKEKAAAVIRNDTLVSESGTELNMPPDSPNTRSKLKKIKEAEGTKKLYPENSTKNNVPPDSPNTRSKMKKLYQKETKDTRKLNFESQGKSSSNRCVAEHEGGGIKKGVSTNDLNQVTPVSLPVANKNKDLEFVLSRVMKNKSATEKKELVPPDQHSLAKERSNLKSLKPESGVNTQNKDTRGENEPLSKVINENGNLDATLEGKKKKIQKMEASSKSYARREITVTEESSRSPRPESGSSNPSCLVDKIMGLAGFSQQPTAADIIPTTETVKKFKIPKKSQATKKSKRREEKDTQLDLFEDLLVGRDRDELLKEIERLKTEQNSLQERLNTSLERCSGLEKDNEVLLHNMSSLWKTSMAQLRQRTHELAAVRREKEAIIFRRAMRQVPRDELDRVASHIAAYDKEEFAEFISKLNEKEEEGKITKCVCARGTPNTRRIGSAAQRERQAARGMRLSPSSDSEAQTLRNLLGSKGETVTHSEEKPGTWSKTSGLTRLKSQRSLFPREGGRREPTEPTEPTASRCIWNRLGRHPLDRRKAGIEDVEQKTCTEEGEVASEGRGMNSNYDSACGSSKKLLLEPTRSKRKSVFSRLSIKRPNDDKKESVSVSSDAPAEDCLSVTYSQVSDSKIIQDKTIGINELKDTGTLDGNHGKKAGSAEYYQSESRKQVCASSEPRGSRNSTAQKPDKRGSDLSEDTVSSVQEPQDRLGICTDNEDEMLSITLFGQRMKRKMGKLTKSPVTKEQKDLSPPSTLFVNQGISLEATQQKRQSVAPLTPSHPTKIRTLVSAELKAMDKVISRVSDESGMSQGLSKQDIQNDEGSMERDENEMRKKSSTWKDSDKQKKVLKQGAIITDKKRNINEEVLEIDPILKAKKDKDHTKKGRGNLENTENNSVVMESGGSHEDDSIKEIDKTVLERNKSTGSEHVIGNNEKIVTTGNEHQQDARVEKPVLEDIDSEQIDTAILSLARLRSAFLNQERKVRTKDKKLNKQKHVNLFGDDLSNEGEVTGKEACKENQETEIHRKVSRNITTTEKQVIEGTTKKKSRKHLGANSHINKEMEELLDMVENVKECENHNLQINDCEKKLKGKGASESNAEFLGLDINKEGLKEKETNLIAQQAENLKEAHSEKDNCIDKRGRSKSLKKASLPDTEEEIKISKKGLTPACGIQDSTLVHYKNTLKLHGESGEVRRKSNKNVIEEATNRDVDLQIEEKAQADSREEDETTCQCTQSSKEASSCRRMKCSKSAEHENDTEITKDSASSSLSKCNEKKIGSRKDSIKKNGTCRTKDPKRGKGKSDQDTETSFSKRRGKKEGTHSQTTTLGTNEGLGSNNEDEANAVEMMILKTPTKDYRAEDASSLIDKSNTQQQNKKDDEEGNVQVQKEGGVENSPQDSKRETAAQKEASTSEVVKVRKSDEPTFDELQEPVQSMNEAECESYIKSSNKSDICAADPTENASMDGTGEDSQIDILKSILETNYDEDSFFSQDDELLYEEGGEDDEDEEEEPSAPVKPQVMEAYDGNDDKSEKRKSLVEESQMKNETDPKKHHKNDEFDKEVHNKLITKDKEVRDADKTSSSPRSVKGKEQDIRTRSNSQGTSSPEGGVENEDTATGKRQTKGDLTPKTREKASHTTVPYVSPPSQTGNLSKLLGGRIKKLTVSPRDKQCRTAEEGVSPLMVREERLQRRRGKKSEPRPFRGEDESPRSHEKRKETPEKGHRSREARSSHVLLSQNRKSPPRLRETRISSRKRERVSESDTSGKRERSPKTSPRTRGEWRSPRQRDPSGEKEQPACKRRRLSVRSRLSFPHNSDEENITRPVRRQPSTPEKEKIRTSSRHRNQHGEKRPVADSHTREPSWQDGAQHSSKKDGKQISTSTVPVDSKLLQCVLAQSPSKLIAEENEKEEGELDEEEEEEEDIAISKNIKNYEPFGTEKTKAEDSKRQPETSKDERVVGDADKNKVKSKEKQSISLDNKDVQSDKARKTDRPSTLTSTNKKDTKLGDNDTQNVSQNQKIKKTSQEKQRHKSGAMERENCHRSSLMRTDDSNQQQTKPLSSRKKSSFMGALKNHETENPTGDGKGAKKHVSNIKEVDQKHKRSPAPLNESLLRKKSPLLEAHEYQEIEKHLEHSANIEAEDQKRKRICAAMEENDMRKKSPLIEALEDQEIKNNKRDEKSALGHSFRIQEDKKHSCGPMDENATFYPGDLYQAIQAKAKSQLLRDTSVSSVSSLSDDTIDLMVRQHNENFSDITNASDDSETSLLKYIADDDGDDEGKEEEEIQVDDISALEEDMAHGSDKRENEGEIQCKVNRKLARMQNDVTAHDEESETSQDAEKISTEEHTEATSMDSTAPCHRNVTPVPLDECDSDGESKSLASPESAPGISERNTTTPVSVTHHSESEEEEAVREQNTATPVSVTHHSDSEEEEAGRDQNTATPVSVTYSDSEEEEASREQNTATPVSVTHHSDSEEEEASREQNTATPVSVTHHSDSEQEGGSREQNTATPVSVTHHSDSEEEENSREQNTATPVSVTHHSDSEEEEGSRELNTATPVSITHNSDSEEEEGSREQNTATPILVTQNSDSEEDGENQSAWNTPTPVSVTQHSDSDEEEGIEEHNAETPFSVTQHSDSEEEEGSGEQNAQTSVSVTQHSDSEEEESSRDTSNPTPVSVTQHSDSEEEEDRGGQNAQMPVSLTQNSDSEEEEGSRDTGNPTPVSVTQHSDIEEEEDTGVHRNPTSVSVTQHFNIKEEKGSGDPGLSAASGFMPDSSEEDQWSSSEESEIDVETVESEPERMGKEIQQNSQYGNNCGSVSVNSHHPSKRQDEDNTELVTESLDENRLATETENIDDISSSSDESDSDSDCQCSDCNKSNSNSSSSSSSSSDSDSSSSSSSDSEEDCTALDEGEDIERPKHTDEHFDESCGQASNLSYDKPATEAAHNPKSPNKTGHKSPKKTPKKTPSKTPNSKLGDSQVSTTPFKKTPRKSPCKKTPCKKSPFKKARGKTPKKGKRVPTAPSAARPIRGPQDTSMTSLGVDDYVDSNEAIDSTGPVSPPNTKDPNVETPCGSQLRKNSGSPGRKQRKRTTTLSDNGSSLSKSHQKQVTPVSDSCITQSFQVKQKVSPLESSSFISKTYHLKRKVSPVKTMNAAPSMPFIETGIVPTKGSSASLASSSCRTMKFTCSDTSPVISVVHSSKGSESQTPQRSAITTPKKVNEEVVTTPKSNKPIIAKKRQRSPSTVLSSKRNSMGKRMRTLSPSMYNRVSPRKLFSETTNMQQEIAIATHSIPESNSGAFDDNAKTSVSKEIVAPVAIRRAKRQLNLHLSKSPEQYSSFNSALHQEDATTSTSQREGGSKGQVLRKSPRKPKRPTKLNW